MINNKQVYPDKNYYDITISNLNTSTTIPPILYFNESRAKPFIDRPEDYYLSIIRFSVDTGQTLPVFIPEIQPNQPNKNLTIYSVSLEAHGFSFQKYVEWTPQNLVAEIPASPSATNYVQDNTTGYYYCFQIQFFVNLVNIAFSEAWELLSNEADITGSHPPVIVYDTQNKIFVLYCDEYWYSNTPPPSLNSPIKIYMNPAMYQLFGSLPITINSISGRDSSGVQKGLNFQIQTDSFGGASIVPFPFSSSTPYQAIQVVQERSSISIWTPCTAIVFTSTTLPIVSNQVSAPLIFFDGRTIQPSNNSNIAPIITDIVSDDGTYTPYLKYDPSAQYRLVSLNGTSPLNNFDLSVFWRDRYGTLNPLRLPSGGSCTLKILFERKDSYFNKQNL